MSSNDIKLATVVIAIVLAAAFFTQSLPKAFATPTAILSLDPNFGSVGTIVSITGEIDTPGGAYRILWDNATLLKEGTCPSGSNEVNDTITVPSSSLGIHTVVLYDNTTSTRASKEFRIGAVCEIQTRNLADLPVAGVTVEVYNATGGSLVAKSATNTTAWARFVLKTGNYSFRAFWKDAEVGGLPNQTISGAFTSILDVRLVEITAFVRDEDNVPLPSVSVTLAYNYTTRNGQLLAGKTSLATNSAGTALFDTFSNMSYVVEARRNGLLFYRSILENLMILPSTKVNITCPSYDLDIDVLDSREDPLGNVQVTIYELDPVRSVGTPQATDSSGHAGFRLTLGKYRISVYNYSAVLRSTVILNETAVDLIGNQSLPIHAIFNIELSVKIVDYFGQPIPNAVVEIERNGVKIGENSTTDQNGTVLLNDLIGGDYRITVYIAGKLAEIETFPVDRPQELLIAAGGYAAIGGYALGIGELTAVIFIVLVVLAFGIVMGWKRILLAVRRSRDTSLDDKR